MGKCFTKVDLEIAIEKPEQDDVHVTKGFDSFVRKFVVNESTITFDWLNFKLDYTANNQADKG